MLARRIIPCLDVREGRVVKGKQFEGIQDVDDPATLGKRYSESGADELVFYDITASSDKRAISLQFVEDVAKNLNIPFCVGGGVKSLDDFDRILRKGADKISVNSSAIDHPNLIKEASLKYGAQCVVLSIDVKKIDGEYKVFKHGGRINTGLDAIEWAKQGETLGAGELVINSMDADGMKTGFDIPLLKQIESIVNIPIIASGGAGNKTHFLEACQQTTADGLLAASVFHFGEIAIPDLKDYLIEHNIPFRKGER